MIFLQPKAKFMFQNKQQSKKLIIKIFVNISNIRDWNLSSIVDYTVYPKDKTVLKSLKFAMLLSLTKK